MLVTTVTGFFRSIGPSGLAIFDFTSIRLKGGVSPCQVNSARVIGLLSSDFGTVGYPPYGFVPPTARALRKDRRTKDCQRPNYLHSLRFQFSFDRNSLPRSAYRARMMTTDGTYYLASIGLVLQNLRGSDDEA